MISTNFINWNFHEFSYHIWINQSFSFSENYQEYVMIISWNYMCYYMCTNTSLKCSPHSDGTTVEEIHYIQTFYHKMSILNLDFNLELELKRIIKFRLIPDDTRRKYGCKFTSTEEGELSSYKMKATIFYWQIFHQFPWLIQTYFISRGNWEIYGIMYYTSNEREYSRYTNFLSQCNRVLLNIEKFNIFRLLQ